VNVGGNSPGWWRRIANDRPLPPIAPTWGRNSHCCYGTGREHTCIRRGAQHLRSTSRFTLAASSRALTVSDGYAIRRPVHTFSGQALVLERLREPRAVRGAAQRCGLTMAPAGECGRFAGPPPLMGHVDWCRTAGAGTGRTGATAAGALPPWGSPPRATSFRRGDCAPGPAPSRGFYAGRGEPLDGPRRRSPARIMKAIDGFELTRESASLPPTTYAHRPWDIKSPLPRRTCACNVPRGTQEPSARWPMSATS